MIAKAARNPERAIGRAPDQLTIAERAELAGKYVALEIYTPETLPLRRIEAVGDSIEECIRMLKARKLDPIRFQYTRITPAY